MAGVDTESLCPCEKAPCGFVDIQNISSECYLHSRKNSYFARHLERECPGVYAIPQPITRVVPNEPPVTEGDT